LSAGSAGLVGLRGYNFLRASAPLWRLGLIMGLADMLGGLLGARTAVARGSRFVRVIFLVGLGPDPPPRVRRLLATMKPRDRVRSRR